LINVVYPSDKVEGLQHSQPQYASMTDPSLIKIAHGKNLFVADNLSDQPRVNAIRSGDLN